MKKQKMKLKDKVQFSIIIGIFAVIVSACVISIWHNDMTASAEDNFRRLEQQVSVTVPNDNVHKHYWGKGIFTRT